MKLWKRLSDRRAEKAHKHLEAQKILLRDQLAVGEAETAVRDTRRARRAEEERQGRIGQGRDHFRSRVLGYRCQRGLPTVRVDTAVLTVKNLPEGGGTGTVSVEPEHVFGRLEHLTARQRRRLRHKFNSLRVTGELEGVVLEDLFRG